VPFFYGPAGIVAAIDANSNDPKGVAVLSSGWGAGQTSTALAMMQANHDPAMNNLKIVVLDNNTNRAGGGFWTTYWMFAPLLLTSAQPTPTDTTVPVVDTAYEYNINSDAPTYPINVLSDVNSLVAYAYDYGAQSTAPMPNEALAPVAPGDQHYHYVVAPDGTYTKTPLPKGVNITYVTFQSDGLPLVRPVRSIPVVGNVVADAVEPTLTTLVNAGYQDNKPIPDNPSQTRPVGLVPPPTQTMAAAAQLPTDVQTGVKAASQDISPTNSKSTVNMTGGNKFSPASVAADSSSAAGANPVHQVVEGITSTIGGLTASLTGQKTSSTASQSDGSK
jgi:hypothetical protein